MFKLLILPLVIASCEQSMKSEPFHATPTPAVISSPTPHAVSLQEQRWNEATVRKEKLHYVQAIANKIKGNRNWYDPVSAATRVPWDVIGGLHYRESDLDFDTHLHNGDPLYAKTRHVPKGRPPGDPPFKWVYSAIDAIKFDHLDREQWRTITERLNNVEAFNGTGYYKYNVPSPYLYSMTTIYSRGKFIADGHYSPTAVDAQAGIAAIWKTQ